MQEELDVEMTGENLYKTILKSNESDQPLYQPLLGPVRIESENGHRVITTTDPDGKRIILTDLDYKDTDEYRDAYLFVLKANIIGVDFNRDTSTIDISLFTDPTPEKPYRKKPVTVRLNINDIAEVLATKLYFNTKGENDVVQ